LTGILPRGSALGNGTNDQSDLDQGLGQKNAGQDDDCQRDDNRPIQHSFSVAT
jgi:hypothetical protein